MYHGSRICMQQHTTPNYSEQCHFSSISWNWLYDCKLCETTIHANIIYPRCNFSETTQCQKEWSAYVRCPSTYPIHWHLLVPLKRMCLQRHTYIHTYIPFICGISSSDGSTSSTGLSSFECWSSRWPNSRDQHSNYIYYTNRNVALDSTQIRLITLPALTLWKITKKEVNQ